MEIPCKPEGKVASMRTTAQSPSAPTGLVKTVGIASVVLILLTANATASPIDGLIVPFAGNDHLYVWVDGPLTWGAANAAAQDYSAVFSGLIYDDWHLVTITSQAENDFLAQTVMGLPGSWTPPFGGTRAWMGLFNEFGANNFEWVTGESTAFTNWNPVEPNNPTGTVGTFGRYADGTWNDEFTSANNGGFGLLAALFEDDRTVPEPSSVMLLGSGLAGLAVAVRRRRGRT